MELSTLSKHVPLCVDCDGTLIHSDLLHESFLLLARYKFVSAIAVPVWLVRHGKAFTKLRIADLVSVDVATLPYCSEVLDYIKREKLAGRRIVLVTASAKPYALAIAKHLQLFDDVIATDETGPNLSCEEKAKCLVDTFGRGGFEYIGNSSDDLPVWAAAGKISIANARPSVAAAANKIGPATVISDTKFGLLRNAVKAMRIHQWLKNILVFAPLFAAHRGADHVLLIQALLAFISFGLCASGVYILNDLLDISSDRKHSTKRLRPFACGSLSIPVGLLLKFGLLGLSLAIASNLPAVFLQVLLIYYAVTLAYSIKLKAQVMVDVVILSFLYTIRILAGSAATAIIPSFWLLAFSTFIFLSLALIKRYAELLKVVASVGKRAAGRGYATEDLVVLLALGTASGYSAVLVFALYINSPDVMRMYSRPQILWLAVPALAYWISRIWLKTHRGEMLDDPVVFAMKDWQSILLCVVIALLGAVATIGD